MSDGDYKRPSMQISPNVQQAILKIFPSQDVLDSPDLDAREFINRNFPDEPSLDDIEPFSIQLRASMKELDEQLSKASHAQRLAAYQATVDLKDARTAVDRLLEKIEDIHGKAQQSETMVQHICRDIKQLDYAKEHLQVTLLALKRLHSLVRAVDQLELSASQRDYEKTAVLLETVNQLFAHFDNYTNVHKIVELHATVRALREELSKQIFADYNAIGLLETLEESFTTKDSLDAVMHNLSAACRVIDALGASTRAKLILEFCQNQLSEYNKVYGKGGALVGLEHADKRFLYFYQLLKLIGSKIKLIFPDAWEMERRLCIHFCESTRSHLLSHLSGQSSDDMNVTALLRTLQRSIQFERDACARFEGSVAEEDGNEVDEDGQDLVPDSAEAIKRKYKRKQLCAQAQPMNDSGDARTNKDQSLELATIKGIISRSFDPFMSAYVQLERKNMEQMIAEGTANEIVDRNGQLPVFSSSVTMFAYIRNSVKRCTALTNGQTFFDLKNEFKRCFQLYSENLANKLPYIPSVSGSTASLESHNNNVGASSSLGASMIPGSLSTYHSKAPFPLEKIEEVCFVVNTAQYCAETLPSLEQVIRQKIDSAFAQEIDLSAEIDLFHDVTAHSLKSLVGGIERAMEEYLQNIPKQNWHSWEAVGDESLYVVQIGEHIRRNVPVVRQMLAKLYFTNFYDKLCASFIPKLMQAIFKCRRVNQVATQQLLLDTCALKALFLQLPLLGNDVCSSLTNTETVPARFTKFVTQEFSRIEMVLKLIGTPNEMLIESFKIMWPEGTAEDLQAIMNVKGLRRQEQTGYLELLGMQRRGKITNMEDKVSDMTETFKKNMQHFAKVPFSFQSQ